MAFRITRSTFQEILSSYEPIPDLDGRSQELDCTLSTTSTNDAHHKLIDKHKWMEERVIKTWGFVSPLPGGLM